MESILPRVFRDVRSIYNGVYLPDVKEILKEIGLEHMPIRELGAGFSSAAFSTPHGQVLKITNTDVVEETGAVNPDSKCVLKPVCERGWGGLYKVTLSPMLNTRGVGTRHVEAVKAMLEIEGYILDDAKPENIGLSPCGLPFVIDPDAVCKRAEGLSPTLSYRAAMFKWPMSQWSIFSCKVEGSNRALTPDKVGYWTLSPHYGQQREVGRAASPLGR